MWRVTNTIGQLLVNVGLWVCQGTGIDININGELWIYRHDLGLVVNPKTDILFDGKRQRRWTT